MWAYPYGTAIIHEGVNNAIDYISTASTLLTLGSTMLMGGESAYLFQAVNHMQLISYFPVLEPSFPDPLYYFLLSLDSSRLHYALPFETEYAERAYEKLFTPVENLTQTDTENYKFDDSGFGNAAILTNLNGMGITTLHCFGLSVICLAIKGLLITIRSIQTIGNVFEGGDSDEKDSSEMRSSLEEESKEASVDFSEIARNKSKHSKSSVASPKSSHDGD